MEPVCWLGIAGVVGIAVALCGMFSKSCKGSDSSCGCGTKTDVPQAKDSAASKVSNVSSGIDEKKEKAINDLIK